MNKTFWIFWNSKADHGLFLNVCNRISYKNILKTRLNFTISINYNELRELKSNICRVLQTREWKEIPSFFRQKKILRLKIFSSLYFCHIQFLFSSLRRIFYMQFSKLKRRSVLKVSNIENFYKLWHVLTRYWKQTVENFKIPRFFFLFWRFKKITIKFIVTFLLNHPLFIMYEQFANTNTKTNCLLL